MVKDRGKEYEHMLKNLKRAVYEANMELWRKNLIVYTWGNVSGIDREAGVVAIKPSGVPYEALKEEDIVLLDLKTGGALEEGSLRPSSDAPTHLVLYRAFPGVGGITHTHSTFATAWAQAGRDLPCWGTTQADYFRGEVPCTRFLSREETGRDYEAETGHVIVETFEGRDPIHTPGVLVRGHGPFTWGKDAAESVYNAVVLEKTAEIALHMLQLAPDTAALPDWIQDKHFYRKHGKNAYYGQKEPK